MRKLLSVVARGVRANKRAVVVGGYDLELVV